MRGGRLDRAPSLEAQSPCIPDKHHRRFLQPMFGLRVLTAPLTAGACRSSPKRDATSNRDPTDCPGHEHRQRVPRERTRQCACDAPGTCLYRGRSHSAVVAVQAQTRSQPFVRTRPRTARCCIGVRNRSVDPSISIPAWTLRGLSYNRTKTLLRNICRSQRVQTGAGSRTLTCPACAELSCCQK